jgi:hypothetical protein
LPSNTRSLKTRNKNEKSDKGRKQETRQIFKDLSGFLFCSLNWLLMIKFYIEYMTIPSPADIRINKIGESGFFLIFLEIRAVVAMMAKMIKPFTSGIGTVSMLLKEKSVLISIVSAVANINPTTQGRMPPRNA